MELKIISTMLFAIIVINILIGASAMPTANNNDNPVTSNDEVTPYPYTQRRYVDLGSIGPEVSYMMQRNNVNIEQIRQMQDRLRDRYASSITSSTTPPTAISENEEDYRISKIQSELQATLLDNTGIDREAPKATFEYAFPAVCEMPRAMNFTEWFGQKTWNIIFKPIYRHFNVQATILRIYKIKTGQYQSESDECNEHNFEMINVKVSVYVRTKAKIFLKKLIHETLMPSSRTGWLEIDVFPTLKYWNNPRNNYGIAIDVFDEEHKQLDAREYFELQNCGDEAGPIIPWNAFKFLAEQSSDGQVSESILEQHRSMYRYPRLDIMSSTPLNKNLQQHTSEEQVNRSQRHIRHNQHSLINEHHGSIDNLVASLKNKSHKRRGGKISRDDNGTAGDT